jgi:hypothetical protein
VRRLFADLVGSRDRDLIEDRAFVRHHARVVRSASSGCAARVHHGFVGSATRVTRAARSLRMPPE